ncbi:MAG: hypothetical protein ACJAZO_003260 [Myxococcota bacterium]|jgi:hypothetical protein
MPFPATIDDKTFATPQELAAAVMHRAQHQPDTDHLLAQAAHAGVLSRDEAVGLCAALIQTGRPITVAVGARLAKRLNDPALCGLLLLAHTALDMGTLLQTAGNNTSVEDLLLGAAAALAADHADHRADVLQRLRNTGQGGDEIRLVARHGTAKEIAQSLPSVLLEGLPADTAESIAAGLKRGGEPKQALLEALTTLDTADKAKVWMAARRLGVDLPDL